MAEKSAPLPNPSPNPSPNPFLPFQVLARKGLKELERLEKADALKKADAAKLDNYEAAASAKDQVQQHTRRSDRSVCVRMYIAGIFNLWVYFVGALLSLTYGVKFGPDSTNEMITVWVIAMFQIYCIIEPVQILIIVCAPFLCDDSTRLGRFCLKARYCYNEFFSP